MDMTTSELAWGGRASRYANNQKRCIEVLDPFRLQICRFPDDLHHALWLTYVLRPGFRKLRTEYPQGTAIVSGRVVKTRFDLFSETTSGVRTLSEVKSSKQLEAAKREGSKGWLQWQAQLCIAEAMRAEYRRVGPETVFEDRVYLHNVIAGVQALTLHAHCSTASVEQRILDYLERVQSTVVGQVISSTGGSSTEVQLALLRMHQRGNVHLDLRRVPYGSANGVKRNGAEVPQSAATGGI